MVAHLDRVVSATWLLAGLSNGSALASAFAPGPHPSPKQRGGFAPRVFGLKTCGNLGRSGIHPLSI